MAGADCVHIDLPRDAEKGLHRTSVMLSKLLAFHICSIRLSSDLVEIKNFLAFVHRQSRRRRYRLVPCRKLSLFNLAQAMVGASPDVDASFATQKLPYQHLAQLWLDPLMSSLGSSAPFATLVFAGGQTGSPFPSS